MRISGLLRSQRLIGRIHRSSPSESPTYLPIRKVFCLRLQATHDNLILRRDHAMAPRPPSPSLSLEYKELPVLFLPVLSDDELCFINRCNCVEQWTLRGMNQCRLSLPPVHPRPTPDTCLPHPAPDEMTRPTQSGQPGWGRGS